MSELDEDLLVQEGIVAQIGVVGEQRDNFEVPPRKLSQLASSSRFAIHVEEI